AWAARFTCTDIRATRSKASVSVISLNSRKRNGEDVGVYLFSDGRTATIDGRSAAPSPAQAIPSATRQAIESSGLMARAVTMTARTVPLVPRIAVAFASHRWIAVNACWLSAMRRCVMTSSAVLSGIALLVGIDFTKLLPRRRSAITCCPDWCPQECIAVLVVAAQ